ncbi:MAG: transaldolase family protein, partial [Halioglobus sp.]|nr:transaldolase family protein [Halioglobus sp.]
ISPALLAELEADEGALPQQLYANKAQSSEDIISLTQARFRYDFNEDAMATEKLAEGIRTFVADQIKLEHLIGAK